MWELKKEILEFWNVFHIKLIIGISADQIFHHKKITEPRLYKDIT